MQNHRMQATSHAESNETTVLDLVLLLFLFCCLYFGAKFSLNVGIKITPIDIAILIGLSVTAIRKSFIFRLDRYARVLLGIIFINSIIELLSVAFIDKGATDNITLGIALIRNAALIFLIVNLNFNDRILKLIIYSGAIFSSIAIAYYMKSLLAFPEVVSNPSLWDPGIFYSFDQGVIRLQGLMEDPNFFFVVNIIPLFFSFIIMSQKFELKILMMFLIILTASLLTFSRSGILVLFLIFLILIFRNISIRKLILLSFFLIALTSFSWYLSETTELPGIYDVFKGRFERGMESGGSGRLELWRIAQEGFAESYIVGQGGRYTLRRAGNYTHNDYLEMLANHGLIGFGGMIVLLIYVVFYIITKLNLMKSDKIFVLSSYLFIFMLLVSMFFTIYYNPYVWFIIAFIFSRNKK